VSHSKLNKARQPLIERDAELARFVVRCTACGRTGLDASHDWESEALLAERYHPLVKRLLLSRYEVLALDQHEMCGACAPALRRLTGDPGTG
jgi:hypothetical protein